MPKIIPEADLINKTITIRDMDLTQSTTITKDSLLRWFLLSIGAISPKESRDTMVKVFDALLFYEIHEQKHPSVDDICDYLKSSSYEANEKTVRYHLNKLIDVGILQNEKRTYFLRKNPAKPAVKNSIEYSLKSITGSAIGTIASGFEKLSEMYENG